MIPANHDLAQLSLSFSTQENQPGITLEFGFFSAPEEIKPWKQAGSFSHPMLLYSKNVV